MQNSDDYSNTMRLSMQEREFMAWDFLSTLFVAVPKDKPKYSYLWLLSQDKTKKITVPFDVTNYDAKEEIAKQAIKFNEEGYNVFFGVNLTDRPMSKHERPHAEDITVQTAIVTDIDCKSAWHDTNKKDYPKVEQAEKFLPFKFSLLVNSGGGLHAYNMFESPLHLSTDEERKQAVSRNKDYIEMVRQNAGDFAGAVDGVHDLPRVLRLPGTYNLKNGRENAPLCKVIKKGIVYNNDKLRELIKPRPITPVTKPQKSIATPADTTNTLHFTDSTEYDTARDRAMLDCIDVSQLADSDWLALQTACKNLGFSYSEIDAKNASDSARYNEQENFARWQSLNDPSFDIETLHGLAKKFGYSEKDFQRDWYQQHPNNKSVAQSDDSLENKLRDVNKKISEFEREKTAATEKLKSQVDFSKDSVFADDILTAAAFCKLYDKKVFADFKACIQNQIKIQGTAKFITEWSGEVRDRITDIKNRESDLLAEKNSINAQIVSEKFVAEHTELKNFTIPEGYSISADGLYKLSGEKSLLVSRVPAVIQSKRVSYEDKTFKLALSYLGDNGKWQNVPATGEEIIFNARKLIDLRAYGLPVTSVNANLFVEYLDAFKYANERFLPMSLNVSRCGWYSFDGNDYFVDPRRKNIISDGERETEITVDDSSTFAQSLKSVGSLDEWQKAYEIAKKSPVARLIVATSVAAPLLNILDGERNFVLYIHGTTRGGKSTCLLCGASAVGNTDMVISFDGTNTGLLARAAETTDYAFFVDEKQSADARLKEQFQRFVYSVANGKERQRANKDGSIKSVREWRNITICNGETELLDDNATGGAFTRVLQIHAPKTILAADDCKEIRRIIRHNYGHALPIVIDKIFDYGFDNLRENFKDTADDFAEKFPNLLDDYRRYVAIVTLADTFLNIALGVDEDAAYRDAVENAHKIFEFVPTIEDISDFEREKDFVLGFIAQNQKYFLGATEAKIENLPFVYGKFDDDFVYITVSALKQACSNDFFDYAKVVADLINDGFFTPDDKIPKGRKKPYHFVLKKISGVNVRCYRIPKEKVVADDLR